VTLSLMNYQVSDMLVILVVLYPKLGIFKVGGW
jgi:hypothetical protein